MVLLKESQSALSGKHATEWPVFSSYVTFNLLYFPGRGGGGGWGGGWDGGWGGGSKHSVVPEVRHNVIKCIFSLV